MKRKGYYEYIPQIYPRRLWVMYNTPEEEIDKCFTNMKGKPLVHNYEPMSEGNYGGMVYTECMNKAGNYLGNLVVFPSKKDMTMRNISHEAFHVLSSINDACDLERMSCYLGSFIEVTCKGNTFRLSTEDVIERGEILEKFDPKKIAYFSISPSEDEWAYNFILGNTRRISKKENFTNNKPSSNAVSDFLNRPTDASAVFRDITNNMFDTYKSKNKDYGDSFHKLFKECGMTYAYGHMAEKLERINSLRKNEAKVKGESMKDSLYDLANYAILTIMELEKTEK